MAAGDPEGLVPIDAEAVPYRVRLDADRLVAGGESLDTIRLAARSGPR